ncbi:transposable element Tcb1 transposase [Trichonephila clavipes]|uniref:Transposable element Tcb1 transposase n=1 Tax=Trichonephila clavipes TaxID=2585209 RepID=A0A8X6R877_TRICX|nr:transposable element Tcb1 transposase [Trichonephila clavipes]
MPRSMNRASFDQVSELDRGRVVAFCDCELLSEKSIIVLDEIQATVMHRWMQEEMTDPTGRSHPPRCTTAGDNRWIVRMAGRNRVATSRTIAQQIQSVTRHSVSARPVRRRL